MKRLIAYHYHIMAYYHMSSYCQLKSADMDHMSVHTSAKFQKRLSSHFCINAHSSSYLPRQTHCQSINYHIHQLLDTSSCTPLPFCCLTQLIKSHFSITFVPLKKQMLVNAAFMIYSLSYLLNEKHSYTHQAVFGGN